jgi:hypothetical protein
MHQLAPLFGLVMPHRRGEGEDLPDRKAAHSKSHKLPRDRRLKGDGVHHAMLGIVRMHGLALVG